MMLRASLNNSLTTSGFVKRVLFPPGRVCCFSNNKPWLNRGIKLLLSRKKKAFMAGDNAIAQKEIIRTGLRS